MGIKIPILEPRVQDASLPGYRQTISGAPVRAGMGALAQGAQQLASTLNQYRLQELEKRDGAALMDAWARVEASWQAREKELSQRRGKDAEGYRQDALELFDKDLESVSETLEAGPQREKFSQLAMKKRVAWADTVDVHIARESEAHAAESYEALQTIGAQNASLAAGSGDADHVKELLETTEEAIRTRGHALGWDDGEIGKERLKRLTPFHAGVVDALLEQGDRRGARDYLGAMRADISVPVASQLEKRIKTGEKKERAAEIALELSTTIRSVTEDEYAFDLTAALRAVNADPELQRDPELRSTVISHLEDEARATEHARRVNDGEKLGGLEQELAAGHRIDRTSSDFADLSRQGKGSILRMEAADFRARRERGSTEEKRQRETDRDLLAYFTGLPLEDQVQVDPSSPPFDDGSSRLRDQIRAKMKASTKEWNTDRGVSRSEFLDKVRARAGVDKYEPSEAKEFEKFVLDRRRDYLDEHPELRSIPADKADEMILEWAEVQAIDWARDEPRWKQALEAERKGRPLPPRRAANEPAAEPTAEPAPPAPALRFPNGPERVTGYADLDAIPMEAWVEIRRLYREGRGEDYTPTPDQVLELYNLLQHQGR